MKNSQLNQVIKLVRRTGDRVVIMDNESEEVMVLLNLKSYEKMLSGDQTVENLTEEQLLEKINRDIAVWRAYNEGEQKIFENDEGAVSSLEKFGAKNGPEQAPPAELKPQAIEKSEENLGSVENEEPLGDVSEDEGEEKFYLEPVE